MSERQVSIHVPILARVEGEGALHLRIRGGTIEDLRLQIYEPPRLFEKFLEGRSFEEIPDMVARICGICPVAYQVSAANAVERLFGVDIGERARALRRLLYCGEWIESHALHIHMLAAPDFFGCNSVLELARSHPDEVRRGLLLHGLGNDLMALVGARAVHPVGLAIGGFHRAPDARAASELLGRLRAALPEAESLVRWVASIPVPDDDQRFACVALRGGAGYAIENGRIVSDTGLDIDADAWESRFAEHQSPYSTALWSTLDGAPYLVGPLARLNINLDRLPAATRALLDATGVAFPSRNMFRSMLARAVEIHLAILESIRILDGYEPWSPPAAPVAPRAGVGFGVSEAPRGVLWHRYEFDAGGLVRAARIVPPTSQNQARIEADLAASLTAFGLERDDAALRLHCEKVIRNYDPCISCATHFLRLTVDRQDGGCA
ncbi:MAG: Ni/Fe hydrogenase subunit alpha [Gammaproteobacteria bacterium]